MERTRPRPQGSLEFDKDKHNNAIITFTARGTSPLMMHQMSQETMLGLINRSSRQKKDITLREKANEGIYRDPATGRIVIPSMCLQACLTEAGRKVTYEKKSMLSTKESSLVPAILDFRDALYPLTPNPEPNGKDDEAAATWVIDTRRGILRNGASKVAVGIVRAKFPEWGFSGEIYYDPTDLKVGPDKIQELLRIGGRYIGIGSFRPTCRGNFGQFKTTSFKVEYFTSEQWDSDILGIAEAAK